MVRVKELTKLNRGDFLSVKLRNICKSINPIKALDSVFVKIEVT